MTDIDTWRGWIGREQTQDDLLTEDLARKFHAMLDLPGDAPRLGEAAPQLIHFCLTQPAAATATLGEDGHPARGGFLPPVALPRRMWAGGSLSFHRPLRVGDAVRRISRIEEVTLKHGRTGRLCFVTVAHRIEAGGELAVEERQDIVYREADSAAKPATPPTAAAPGTRTRPQPVSAPLLFRYSALTFNGHRIHYDHPYVTQVEGYPGLVVHGPMQATWLLHYATELRGALPRSFTFRGQSPLFDNDVVSLNATDAGDSMKLWTSRTGGPVAMAAEVFW
ncbi:MAG: MaoC family dehydratase N-terminal domain-containing protein [Acetobacteraceae bacterium]|nr:MaoC family dehydratase N-terminal domain-containing protein [Acetobacteraceae bacterium]